ncbi:MAG TPA: hypothetical protein DIW07_08905 [Lachnospiraceae bacterium]|nr:hypothetical protein [Lachnospiraceae bacterium]
MIKIDLSKHSGAQDMVAIIMRDKNLSAEDALKYAINKTMYQNIIKAGYASIALGLWGHADPEREWDVLESPIMQVEFDESTQNLINDIMEKEDVDFETAISYFLLFTMEALGYHI